ncbi:MAG: 3-phosphoshikimate 1-carboxyvinyltransferase, partial [Waddliaceae bacterium]
DAKGEIDAGNSGIVLRFIAGIAALGDSPIVITGDHSIRHQRPMGPLLEALNRLGVKAESANGYAPIMIQGPLRGGRATVNGQDSQPVSALLMAGSLCANGIDLEVAEPGEKPWVDVTLAWLQRLGVPIENDEYKHYRVPGGAVWDGFEYTVPGDWSSAAFPMAAALVTGSELTINNGNLYDSQGDKVLVNILRQMGANIEENDDSLHVASDGTLEGIEVDINDCIDVITIVSVIACHASGTTRITNAGVARSKECNRIACIASELKKMGAQIAEMDDGLVIEGSKLHGAEVESYGDHRMAMSLAVAALGATGTSVVNDVDCVAKTYGSFPGDFRKMGANIEVVQ